MWNTVPHRRQQNAIIYSSLYARGNRENVNLRRTLNSVVPQIIVFGKKTCKTLSLCGFLFFLSDSENRLWLKLKKKKKKKKALCKRVKACGWVWNYSWSYKTGETLPFLPSGKTEDVCNSCNPGGFPLGNCSPKTTNISSNHLAQSFSCCFLNENTDLYEHTNQRVIINTAECTSF